MSSTPAKKEHTPLRIRTPGGAVARDNLVKVTFQVKHAEETPDATMFVVGSLPSMGSWEPSRARKMTMGEDGAWQLAIYLPERVEFMYQYLLIQNSEDEENPNVLWEGNLERKAKIENTCSTPQGKQLMLDDNTIGEQGTPSRQAASAMRFDPLASGPKEGLESKLQLKQTEIETMVKEREQCQNELQKLKDIIGYAAAPNDYKNRQSFLPDCGPLYETVRQVQASIAKKMAKQEAQQQQQQQQQQPAISEEQDATAKEMADKVKELETAHEAEKKELREYYDGMLGRLDSDQAVLAESRRQEEQQRTMLQTSVRCAAGELQEIKEAHGEVKAELAQLRDDVVPSSIAILSAQISEHILRITGGMETQMDEAQTRLRKEVQERKRLHNLVQELRGNIRVFCRVRPLSASNRASGQSAAVAFPTEADVVVESGGKQQSFQYDRVFDPASSAEDVFQDTQPLVVSVLDGYNVCIFAYGQTGSGKTHTMQGYGEHKGVNTRALEELFGLAEEREGVYQYTIKVSLLEIYNETIRDLIEPREAGSNEEKKLDVKIAPEGGTCVPGISVVQVDSMDDVDALLAQAAENRSVGRTNLNEHSSRSHMILSVYTANTNLVNGTKGHGKLHLIDLAGSERISKSGAKGERLKEAQNINKSLSALGDCVQSLVSKSKHVPFRNSKLTYLLQDSLGGESKALMFVCASPADADAPETICSLNFAARVRNVELGPATKRKGGEGALAEMKLKEKEREVEAGRERERKADADAKREREKARALEQQLQEALEAKEEALSALALAHTHPPPPPNTLAAPTTSAAAPVIAAPTEEQSVRMERSGGSAAVCAEGGRRGSGTKRQAWVGKEDSEEFSARGRKRQAVTGATNAAPCTRTRSRSPAPSSSCGGSGSGSGTRTPLGATRGNRQQQASSPRQQASSQGGGATTPRWGSLTAAKPKGEEELSLDERLANLRQSRAQTQASLASKGVCFNDLSASSDSLPLHRAPRPLTAPPRAPGHSRLASGAARVSRAPDRGPSSAAAGPVPMSATRASRRAGANGGWR